MKLPLIIQDPPNKFDLEHVHRDLTENENLWISVTYMHHQIGTFGDPDALVKSTHYYLLVRPGMEEQVVQMAIHWEPGKLEWTKADKGKATTNPINLLSGRGPKILKVTWVK